jgi:DNA-binding CsgD family transcriptional regulator
MARAGAVLERVERLCSSGLGAKTLREQVLAELRRVLAFDAHVWLLTDPVTRVGTSPLADVPMLPWPRLPELGRLRYLTRVNRWSELTDAGRHTGLLAEETAGQLDRSLVWRECLHGLGVVDVATVAMWDRFGCWAWLDLWRCGRAPPYTSGDRELLTALAAPVTRGLREAQARTFDDHAEGLHLRGPAAVVLGPGLQVRHQTAWAADALYRLNPPEEQMPPIPAAVYNVGAALIAAEAGVPVGEPTSRVHLGAGRWVTLRAARMTGEPAAEADMVVTIEASTPAERRDVFGRAHGLSPREREVLAALARGLDYRAVARTLAVSEHTVHDHVKAVLAKTATGSRQALVSRIAGVS